MITNNGCLKEGGVIIHVLVKNHERLQGAYLDELLATQSLGEKAQSQKISKLNAFVNWLNEQEDIQDANLLKGYETYLKLELRRADTTVETHLKEITAYLTWFEEQAELITSLDNKFGYIVGMGASAGGLEALERFFGSEFVSTNLSYVVIQHLSPDFKSMMPEILARVTQLPIHSIESGMKIQPGHIYLNNPRSDVRIQGNVFEQEDRSTENMLHLPINTFFKSLAAARRKQAIAVILSGTGRDGSSGVNDIHENGGLVIVQDSKSALYASMPETAATQGPAHLVLNPMAMPEAINDYVSSKILPEQEGVLEGVGITTENAFSYLLSLLQRAFGIDFNAYKNATLVRRVERRMNLGNFHSLEQFVSKLQEDSDELDALYRDMLVDVTSFFRDEDAFHILEKEVIPTIVDRKQDGDVLRIWTAACASGEESYSLAILFEEEILKQNKKVELKVFATDAHKDSILRASMGVFDTKKLESVPPALRGKYFLNEEDHIRIEKNLRQKIIFAPHDLLSDGNFSNLDFVSCRNMLIYLKPEAQLVALTQFSNGLNHQGILFLGSSEHLGTLKDYYDILSEKWRIYKKSRNLPLQQSITNRMPMSLPSKRTTKHVSYQGWERDLVKRLATDGYVVDSQGQLIEIFGEAKKHLQFRAGKVNLSLSSVLDEPLATTVKSGLYNVKESHEPLTLQGIAVNKEAGEYLDISFIPFEFNKGDSFLRYYFIQLKQSEFATTGQNIEVRNVDMDRVLGLERELEFTRESLQASLEEVETTNEELQSTNEELIASNEELQSTNEELSSVNEELITVNAEYQAQNKRLNQSNSDLENLLQNSETLAIFLSKDLHIRMVTPSAFQVFELLESDIGRPIHHFAPFMTFGENIVEDMCKAALEGERKNLSVTLRNQRKLELSVIPYETSLKGIDGVVLKFIDVTTVMESTVAPLEKQVDLLQKISRSAPNIRYVYEIAEAKTSFVAGDMVQLLGYSIDEFLALNEASMEALFHREDLEKIAKYYASLPKLKEGESKTVTYRFMHKLGHWVWLQTQDSVFERHEDGSIKSTLGLSQSIDAQKSLENYSSFNLTLFELSPNCLDIISQDGILEQINPSGRELMEIDDFNQFKGKPWASLWPDPKLIEAALAKAKEEGFVQFEAFCPTAKGTPKWWDVHLQSFLEPETNQLAFISSAHDITAMKAEAEKLQKDNVRLEEELRFVEQLHQNSLSVMYIYDVVEDKNVYATGNVLQMLGYNSEELQALGPNLLEQSLHPDDLEKLGNHHLKLNDDLSTRHHVFDYRMKHKNGSWVALRSIDSVYERDEFEQVKYILGHVIKLDTSRA